MENNLHRQIARKPFKDDREPTSPFVCQRCGEDKLRVIEPSRQSINGETVAVICVHCGIEAWLQADYSFGPDERPNVRIVR